MDSNGPTPHDRQFNVRLPERTHKLIAVLQAHYGFSQARLIEQVIEQAAAFAKREVAATSPTKLTEQVSATESDEDESGVRQPPQFTHDGTFIPRP